MIDYFPSSKEKEHLTTPQSSKHKNRIRSKIKSYQNGNVHLNKLFYDSASIQTSRASLYAKETEKERELRLIENLNFNQRKLDKHYHEKLIDLLQIKRDPDYSLMRKNIDKVVYETDDNQQVHLSLPQCLKRNRLRKKREQLTEAADSKSLTVDKKHILLQSPIAKEQKAPKRDIAKLIPEFNRSNEDKGNSRDVGNQIDVELNDQHDTISHLTQEEQKKLFDPQPNKLNPIQSKRTRNTLTIANTKNDEKEVQGLFELFDQYISKSKLLKHLRQKKEKKAAFQLEGADLFYYNAKRWEERRKNKQSLLHKEDLLNKKEETKQTLKLMIESYDKLNEMMKKIKSNEVNDLSPSKRHRLELKTKFTRDNTFLTSPELYKQSNR